MDFYIGQIIMVGFNFAPDGWLICDGREVSISDYEPLYSLIGLNYGGDGRYNFRIPDFKGRAPVCYGRGDFSNTPLGTMGGINKIKLSENQLPSHTHYFNPIGASNNPIIKARLNAIQNPATSQPDPQNNLLGVVDNPGAATIFTPANSGAIVPMAKEAVTISITSKETPVGNAGKGDPIDIMQPYLAVNFIICTQGIYPSTW